MDQDKIGKFIAELRKKKKMTQEELGNKIGVTDKTISRWETGKYMPDISLFKPLSEILDVSINDLMSGEIIDKKDYQEKFEENVIEAISTVKKENKKSNFITNILLGIMVLFIILFSGYIFYSNIPFIIKYDADDMLIKSCDIDSYCENELMFYSTKSRTSFKYLLTTKVENNEEIGLIFVTTWHTLKDINNDKMYLSNSNYIDLSNKYSYGSAILINNDKYPKKYKIYYTNTKFTKIANANEKQLEKIINKSDLMFEKK